MSCQGVGGAGGAGVSSFGSVAGAFGGGLFGSIAAPVPVTGSSLTQTLP